MIDLQYSQVLVASGTRSAPVNPTAQQRVHDPSVPAMATSKVTPVVTIPINTLLPADSPRLGGVAPKHVAALVGVDGVLPPILVHRQTMRVIDGVHRVAAARSHGELTIQARLVDGDDEFAFILAVQANTSHGLPLTLAERESAATRIVTASPQRSDRAIAKLTGLAAPTVAAIRRRTNGQIEQLHTRIGLDGRSRPVDGARGRRLAGEVIARTPEASLRKIARLAGISPTTARDVRERMRRGEDPVTGRQRTLEQQRNDGQGLSDGTNSSGTETRPTPDVIAMLDTLRRDPSLRLNDSGRALLRWLGVQLTSRAELKTMSDAIPPHCAELVADLAREFAETWLAFSAQLGERVPRR